MDHEWDLHVLRSGCRWKDCQRSAAAGKGGARKLAIGRSRGGRTTKIHGIADSQGRLFRFSLTAGNIADITAAHELAAKLPCNGCLIGDMGYDAKKLRVDLAFRGTAGVPRDGDRHPDQSHAQAPMVQ